MNGTGKRSERAGFEVYNADAVGFHPAQTDRGCGLVMVGGACATVGISSVYYHTVAWDHVGQHNTEGDGGRRWNTNTN